MHTVALRFSLLLALPFATDVAAVSPEELRSRLAQLPARVQASRSSVTEITGSGLLGEQCRNLPAVDRGQFTDAIQGLRSWIDANLSDPELMPLRDYVDERIPKAHEFPSPSQRLARCFPGYAVLPSQWADAAWKRASAMATTLASLASLTLTLEVQSQPNSASFRFETENGSSVRADSTDTIVENLYRGLYVFRISKAGHKPALLPLNLVDATPFGIRCTLQSATNEDDSACQTRTGR